MGAAALAQIRDGIADQPAGVVYDLVKNHQALSDLAALIVEGLPGGTVLDILKRHPELSHLASSPPPNVATATPHSAHALTRTDGSYGRHVGLLDNRPPDPVAAPGPREHALLSIPLLDRPEFEGVGIDDGSGGSARTAGRTKLSESDAVDALSTMKSAPLEPPRLPAGEGDDGSGSRGSLVRSLRLLHRGASAGGGASDAAQANRASGGLGAEAGTEREDVAVEENEGEGGPGDALDVGEGASGGLGAGGDAPRGVTLEEEAGAERDDVAMEDDSASGGFDAQASRLVTNLSRVMLFKALGGDAIDKPRVIAEALGEGLNQEWLANAAMDEAEKRLMDVFGFDARQVSEKMMDDLPDHFKTRYYLTNEVADDDDGSHRRALHSANAAKAAERALLMNVLAFAYCKGATQVHGGVMKGAGKKTRWITEHDLYALLHVVDESIPKEPPSAEGKKRSRQSAGSRLSPNASSGEGARQTPDVDVLLEQFVAMDYLLRDKIDEPEGQRGSSRSNGRKVVAYAMGPRAVLEIGRRQIILFCSGVLGYEQPDPTMMAEIDKEDEEEESESEEEESESEESESEEEESESEEEESESEEECEEETADADGMIAEEEGKEREGAAQRDDAVFDAGGGWDSEVDKEAVEPANEASEEGKSSAANDDAGTDAEADADQEEALEDGGGPPDTAQRLNVVNAIDGAESGMIYLDIAKMFEFRWTDGGAVMIWTREGKTAVCTLVAEESEAIEGHSVSMDEGIQRSLGINSGDKVYLDQITVPPGAQIRVRPTNLDQLVETYLRPLLMPRSHLKAGDVFTVPIGGVPIEFEVVGTDPSQHCHVHGSTEIVCVLGGEGGSGGVTLPVVSGLADFDPKAEYGDKGFYFGINGRDVKIGISQGKMTGDGLSKRVRAFQSLCGDRCKVKVITGGRLTKHKNHARPPLKKVEKLVKSSCECFKPFKGHPSTELFRFENEAAALRFIADFSSKIEKYNNRETKNLVLPACANNPADGNISIKGKLPTLKRAQPPTTNHEFIDLFRAKSDAEKISYLQTTAGKAQGNPQPVKAWKTEMREVLKRDGDLPPGVTEGRLASIGLYKSKARQREMKLEQDIYARRCELLSFQEHMQSGGRGSRTVLGQYPDPNGGSWLTQLNRDYKKLGKAVHGFLAERRRAAQSKERHAAFLKLYPNAKEWASMYADCGIHECQHEPPKKVSERTKKRHIFTKDDFDAWAKETNWNPAPAGVKFVYPGDDSDSETVLYRSTSKADACREMQRLNKKELDGRLTHTSNKMFYARGEEEAFLDSKSRLWNGLLLKSYGGAESGWLKSKEAKAGKSKWMENLPERPAPSERQQRNWPTENTRKRSKRKRTAPKAFETEQHPHRSRARLEKDRRRQQRKART